MLTAKLMLSIAARHTNPIDLMTPEADLAKSYAQEYADGTGANQAQLLFTDSRTAAGSSTDNLDLAGVLAGDLSAPLTFAGVKELIIKNKSATNQLRIGKKITNGFAGPFDQTAGALGVVIEPNAPARFSNPSAAGWAVTPGTADQLSIENLGATATDYDVIIIGK